jgi:hypothetical protein
MERSRHQCRCSICWPVGSIPCWLAWRWCMRCHVRARPAGLYCPYHLAAPLGRPSFGAHLPACTSHSLTVASMEAVANSSGRWLLLVPGPVGLQRSVKMGSLCPVKSCTGWSLLLDSDHTLAVVSSLQVASSLQEGSQRSALTCVERQQGSRVDLCVDRWHFPRRNTQCAPTLCPPPARCSLLSHLIGVPCEGVQRLVLAQSAHHHGLVAGAGRECGVVTPVSI